MLESIIKCYMSDLKYPDLNDFREKLTTLETHSYKKHITTSSLMKKVGSIVGLVDDVSQMWDLLSDEWVHPRGILDGIIEQIIKKSDVPPCSLVLQMGYNDNDLDVLNKLKNHVLHFSKILSKTLEHYKNNIWNFTTVQMKANVAY